jgi:hypothetical protein
MNSALQAECHGVFIREWTIGRFDKQRRWSHPRLPFIMKYYETYVQIVRGKKEDFVWVYRFRCTYDGVETTFDPLDMIGDEEKMTEDILLAKLILI